MKATVNVMKRLAKNLENTSFICSSDVKLTVDDNDCIVASMRYEDGNSYTIVCHLFEDDVQIGYFLSDGTYKWYATAMLKSFKDTADFLFYMGIKLKEVSEYIEKYVIDTETAEETTEETPEQPATPETNESEVNEMNNEMDNEMYINNEYRAEYFDPDLNIWVTIDDLTHMTAENELEVIEAAVEYLAYSDYESGNGDDIDELKAKWYAVEWRAAQEINPEYNADYKWKYE